MADSHSSLIIVATLTGELLELCKCNSVNYVTVQSTIAAAQSFITHHKLNAGLEPVNTQDLLREMSELDPHNSVGTMPDTCNLLQNMSEVCALETH